jgi:hypothetical protein
MATACDDMILRLFDLGKLAARDPSFKHHEMRNTPLGVGFGNNGHSLVVALRGLCTHGACVYWAVQGVSGMSLCGLHGGQEVHVWGVCSCPQQATCTARMALIC